MKYYSSIIISFFLLFSFDCFADEIHVEEVLVFDNPVRLPLNFISTLDCSVEYDFSIRDNSKLRRNIINYFSLKGLNISDLRTRYKINIAVTDHICGQIGMHNEFVSPLGLFGYKKDSTVAYMRVVLQLYDENFLVYSNDYTTTGVIEANRSNYLWYQSDIQKKEISLKNMWLKIVTQMYADLKKAGL